MPPWLWRQKLSPVRPGSHFAALRAALAGDFALTRSDQPAAEAGLSDGAKRRLLGQKDC